MMTDDQMRDALYGRNLSKVSRDSGVPYTAIYQFVGKPLSMFERVALSDYLERLAAGLDDGPDDAGTWGELAAAIEINSAEGGL